MVFCDTDGTQIVDFSNIQQIELPITLTQIAQVVTGHTAIQIFVLACNFGLLNTGYDLKARPEATANKHFWRSGKTALARKLIGGHTEFWNLTLRPRESWIIEGIAETANAIALTLSTAELVNSLVPDACA